jgi:tripartite-type tricarboxylate transporter receptor subunit TctC
MRKYQYLFICLLIIALMGLFITGCGSNNQDANQGEQNEANTDANPDASQGEQKEASSYPEKPINFWIPYDVGGGSDIISRILVEAVQPHLPNAKFIIVNKPGTSGLLGMKELHEAKADGYTIMTNTTTIVTHKLLGAIPYNHRDYDMIISFNNDPGAIAVPADKPWKDINEFMEYAKKNKVKISTSANGGIWNVALRAFLSATGIEADIVAEGGGAAKAITMAAGGHVDAVCASPLEMYTQLQGGNLRLLTVFGSERLAVFPDVPTMLEATGIDLPVTTTRQLLGPKGMPKEVVDILVEAFSKAAQDPKYIKSIEDMASVPILYGPEETYEFFDKEEKFFEKVLRESGQIE